MKKQISSKKIAVVVMDMQNFFLKKFPPAIKNILISNQSRVIDFCVKNKLPFIVIEYKCRGVSRGKTIQKLEKKIQNVHVETIIKENNSGFTNTQLDSVLKKLKVKEILLIGINANGCIQDTAIGALRRGYGVIISQGVIASSSRKDLELSKRNKRWFKKNTVFFDRLEEIFEYLSR